MQSFYPKISISFLISISKIIKKFFNKIILIKKMFNLNGKENQKSQSNFYASEEPRN